MREVPFWSYWPGARCCDKADHPRKLCHSLTLLPAGIEACPMTIFLALLIGLFAVAAATALVRGLKAFFDDGEQIRLNGKGPQEAFGVRQNRMMSQRVLFQGIAVLLVALIGALASKA
jgi:hypothetical protein